MLIVNARLKNAIEAAIAEYKTYLSQKNRQMPYFRQNDIEEIEAYLDNDKITSELYLHVLQKKNDLRTGGIFNVVSQNSKLKYFLNLHVFNPKTAGFSLIDLMNEDIQSIQIRSSTKAILSATDMTAADMDAKKTLKIEALSQELGKTQQALLATKQDCMRLKDMNAMLLKQTEGLEAQLYELDAQASNTQLPRARPASTSTPPKLSA